MPSPAEVEANPRSRSAKMRVAERMIGQDDCGETEALETILADAKGIAWKKPVLLQKLKMVFAAS